MAKQKINKSAAIREYFKQHRRASAQQVVEALAGQGIQVTTGLVYAAKRKIRGRRRRRLAAVAVATKNVRNGAVDPVKLVQETKALAQKAGGIKKLKELLDVLG